MSENIFPVFSKMISRKEKQQLLRQRSTCLWLTGLSGSGKTTLALGLERELFSRGFLCQVLDGDNIRTGLNSNLGFSEEDRKENIRRIAELNKLFLQCGIITINCFVSPTREIRNMARNIIGNDDFMEIYVKASLATCEQRDVKGLYKKARAGKIPDFTGIHQPFEEPTTPQLVVNTEKDDYTQCLNKLLNFVIPIISHYE